MADRRPVTLDDLDRDELLHLVRNLGPWPEAALIWAQWLAACDRRRLAWDAYQQAFDAAREAFDAWLDAGQAHGAALHALASTRTLDRLSRAYNAADRRRIDADAAQRRAKAKVDRAARREDALYARYQELTDAP